MSTARSATRIRRFSVSMPAELVRVLDELARERGASRSAVLAELTAEAERRRIQAVMAHGYQEMATLNRQLAAAALPAAAEVMLRND